MKIAQIAAVAVVLSITGTSVQAGATTTKTTKKKVPAKTVPKRPSSTLPPTTRVATTRVTTTTINPISDRAVRAAYDHFIDVRYALLQDARPYRSELAKVAAGDALSYWLDFYDGFRVGDHWTGKREEMKAFDFRVIELSRTAAVVRVCQYESAAPTVDKAGAVIPNSDSSTANDSRLEFQYAGKRGWLLSADYIMQDTEGKSTCADGKV